MLKRDITYTDFNDEKQTETHWFHLSKTEIVNLEVEYDGGLQGFIKRIIAASDNNAIIKEFQRVILLSYGKKSPDGRSFTKSDEDRLAFSQTAAFDELFIQLSTNTDLAVQFMQGILPSDLSQQMKENATLAPPTITPVERKPPAVEGT